MKAENFFPCSQKVNMLEIRIHFCEENSDKKNAITTCPVGKTDDCCNQ